MRQRRESDLVRAAPLRQWYKSDLARAAPLRQWHESDLAPAGGPAAARHLGVAPAHDDFARVKSQLRRPREIPHRHLAGPGYRCKGGPRGAAPGPGIAGGLRPFGDIAHGAMLPGREIKPELLAAGCAGCLGFFARSRQFARGVFLYHGGFAGLHFRGFPQGVQPLLGLARGRGQLTQRLGQRRSPSMPPCSPRRSPRLRPSFLPLANRRRSNRSAL